MFTVIWGLLTGIFALAVWRFVTPPRYGELSFSQEGARTQMEFSIRVSDPAFVPLVPAWLTFPVTGLILGFFVGTVLSRIGVRNVANEGRRTTTLTWLLCGALGLVTGLVSAATLQWSPPTVFVGPEIAERTGFPPQLEVPWIWLTLPSVGIILGVLAAVALQWNGSTIVRDQSHSRSETVASG